MDEWFATSQPAPPLHARTSNGNSISLNNISVLYINLFLSPIESLIVSCVVLSPSMAWSTGKGDSMLRVTHRGLWSDAIYS